MLDPELAREIRRAAPQRQDRDAYFAFVRKIEAANKEMSSTEVRTHFDDMLKKHGRVVTAIVVAATLLERQDRLEGWRIDWANEVIKLWPHSEGHLHGAAIDDGLHPTRICEYAGSFIRLTSIQ